MTNDCKSEQQTSNNAFRFKFLGGGVLGLINSTAVTPFINYTNHAINQQSMGFDRSKQSFTLKRMFDGLGSYNVSFVLRISVALSLDSYFLHKLGRYYTVDKQHKLLSSILAGGIAGSVATLSEAVAQAQQLSKDKPSSIQVIKTAYHANGLFRLFPGTAAMVVRSSGLTAGYISLMPMLCQHLKKKLGDNLMTDILAATICGLFVGIITTPPNNARFEMQKDFMVKGPAPSYRKIWKGKCTSHEGRHSLLTGLRKSFGGFHPQTLRCMLSMFILMKGNEKLGHLYDSDGFSNFLNGSSPRV
ncbi:MAG: hypothetical protein KBB94_08655 [Legionellaceae bacterium]|nr:hypothetical protein [Legionellaceae bacterium]MBP9776106.1 hypothetical protein [Legionellaceae bacterium]